VKARIKVTYILLALVLISFLAIFLFYSFYKAETSFICTPGSLNPFCFRFLRLATMPGCEWKYTQYLMCKNYPSDPMCTSSKSLHCGSDLYGNTYDVTDCVIEKDTGSGWTEVTKLKKCSSYSVPANSYTNWAISGFKCPTCTDECSSGATKCENKKLYSCRNCDSDPCVEWCYDKDVQCCSNADCPSGYTCQNYSCVGATVSGTLNLIFQGILNLFRIRLI
jgi:hypothetical protein